MKKKFLIKMHFCENHSTIEPHFSHIDMHKKAMYVIVLHIGMFSIGSKLAHVTVSLQKSNVNTVWKWLLYIHIHIYTIQCSL